MEEGKELFAGFEQIDLMEEVDVPSQAEEKNDPAPVEEKKETEKKDDDKQVEDGTIDVPDAIEEFIEKKDSNKKEIEVNKEPPQKVDDSSPSSPYLSFAKVNSEEGVFNDFTDEEWNTLVEEHGEAGALVALNKEAMNTRILKEVEAYKESLPLSERKMYEAKEKGIEVNDYVRVENAIDNYNKISKEDIESDEKIQIAIIKENLYNKGFSHSDIEEQLDMLEQVDKLESTAIKNIEENKSFLTKQKETLGIEAKEKTDNAQKAYEHNVETARTSIDSMTEIIPGIKLTDKAKDDVFKSLVSPSGKDASGNPINEVVQTRDKNPIAFEILLHYYHKLGLFDIDKSGQIKPDFSKIINKAKSNNIDDLEKTLRANSGNFKNGKSRTTVNAEKSQAVKDFESAFGNIK